MDSFRIDHAERKNNTAMIKPIAMSDHFEPLGATYELANFDRSDFIFTKEELVKHGNFTQSRVKH